jgi:hypothetical protein
VYESFVSSIQSKWEPEETDLKVKNKIRTIRKKCHCKENDKYREDGGTMMDPRNMTKNRAQEVIQKRDNSALYAAKKTEKNILPDLELIISFKYATA